MLLSSHLNVYWKEAALFLAAPSAAEGYLAHNKLLCNALNKVLLARD